MFVDIRYREACGVGFRGSPPLPRTCRNSQRQIRYSAFLAYLLLAFSIKYLSSIYFMKLLARSCTVDAMARQQQLSRLGKAR
jgi:hypothetical protein